MKQVSCIVALKHVPNVGIMLRIDEAELQRVAAGMDVPSFRFLLSPEIFKSIITPDDKNQIAAALCNHESNEILVSTPAVIEIGLNEAGNNVVRGQSNGDIDLAYVRSAVAGVLAHEVRHAWQFSHHRWRMLLLASAARIFFGVLCLSPLMLQFPFLFALLLTMQLPFSFLPFLGIIAWSFNVAPMTALAIKSAACLAYKYSWHERDARRFEKAACGDPKWLNVVELLFTPVTPNLHP